MTIEDISGSMEFFMMDSLDLQVGNIVTIIGRKSKNARLQQIFVHDRTAIIKKLQANGSYQEKDPITNVRKQRASDRLHTQQSKKSYTILSGIETSTSSRSHSIESNESQDRQSMTEENEPIQPTSEDQEKSFPLQGNIFQLPEELSNIQTIIMLLKQYTGEKDIII